MGKFFNKYIILVLSFYAIWLGILPAFLSNTLPVICENLSYNSEFNIKIENPHIALNILPIVKIKADNFELKRKNSDDRLTISGFNSKIRILPLLSGKVHINNLGVDKLDIKIKLDKNAALDKDFFEQASKMRLKLDSFSINDVLISLQEDGTKKNAVYKAKNVNYKKNNRYIKLFVDSNITVENKNSSAKIDLFLQKNNVEKSSIEVKINNFDLEPLGNFLKNYLPSDLVDVRGIVDIDINKNKLSAFFKNVAVIMNDDGNSMIFPKLLELNSDFSLSENILKIHQAKIKSKNIDIALSGTITDYIQSKFPNINLNLRINKSRVEDFISMMPPIQTIDIDGYKLKKYKFFGDVIGNLTIKGDSLEPSLNGDIYITEGILIKPIPNTKPATIKLNFTGKYVNFDVQVPASQREKVWVKGGVELYNVKYSDMRVWSTQNVDLATAQEKVNPLHEILKFVVGPVPIMDIKGRGNIDITIKGNRKDPHVWGVFNLFDVKTYFLEIPNLVMNDADASLTFDDENVVFKMTRGKIDGNDINIKGTATLGGKFDFDTTVNNQELSYLYRALKTSTLLDDIKKMLPDFDLVSGHANSKFKVYGNILDINNIKFNENFFIKGHLDIINGVFGMRGVNIHNTHGFAEFDGLNNNLDISSKIGKSPLYAKGYIKNSIADLSISIPNLNLKDILPSNDKIRKQFANIFVNVSAKYKGNSAEIEPEKIDFLAKILGSEKNNKLQISNGEISLKRGKFTAQNIDGKFLDTVSSFKVNISADNLFSTPVFNGNITLKDFELSIINMIGEIELLPKELRNYINQIKFKSGKINLKADVHSNNLNASTDLGGISFVYAPLGLPVKVVNGSIYARKDYLGLNKINLLADGMPVLIDGRINHILTQQDFDIYINSKPKQEFIDKYFNNNKIYPLKIRGDIVYWTKLKGVLDNYDLKLETDMAKDSSIYYLGATVGDIENAIKLYLDINVIKNSILKIKDFSYDKIIDSQGKRKTKLNMLKASGGIELLKDDIGFNNLHIKTQNPTDARIFNIIFRQANIKQGQFTSDLYYNGKMSNPKILGSFHIFETNIPFLDTTMKNISFVFKDKFIDISALGEVMGNDIKLKGTMRNSLRLPYYIENAELYTKVLDFNYITDRIKQAQVDEDETLATFGIFDLKNVIIKRIKMSANGVKLRNISAENIEAIASLNKNQDLKIDSFKFNIANGNLKGDFLYNLKTGKTSISLDASEIDANSISQAVFDLNNQIHGKLTGEMSLACNGSSFEECMQTLNGNSTFNVTNGRIPKLGSLEYLLRAGNLLKGGVTGISINSIIDIISPMKTGEFSSIYGIFSIKDGKTKDLEISSKGKNLSLFISGSYNFATSDADMQVFGLLSKKISTMFGPIGNVSINTLFNVIPGINLEKDSPILDKINKIPALELSDKAYRKFVADIMGNINSDNYVKSFKWIN